MKPPSPSRQHTLLDELNPQRHAPTKTGKTSFTHPHETHDDRLWALAAHAAEQPTPSPPIAKN